MNIIKDEIKKNRPKIGESSINTYTSILKNLHKKSFPDAELNLNNFNDFETISKYLKDVKPNSRKTILSALFVITQNNQFQQWMMNDAMHYNKEQVKQEKTDTQKDNWIEQKDIKNKYSEYEKNVKILLKLDRELTNKEIQYYQNYIIICLTSGIFFPPRRLKDWSEFKIKNVDKKEDNYLRGALFVFNNYKTKKYYGEQSVKIPTRLKTILNKFIHMNDSDYLLTDSHGNKLTPVKLNQRLCKIFGKNISVNILRHSFLTDKYKNVPALKDMQETAKNMSQSVNQALLYVKK